MQLKRLGRSADRCRWMRSQRNSTIFRVIIYLISGDEILVCGSGVVAYQDAPEL
jgi:hypothetical protein